MSAFFTHLHLHSEFSLQDGLIRVKPLMQAVAQAGMPAVALTDQGNLFGAVKFYRAAVNAGVKPIIGAEIRVADAGAPEGPTRLVLLCADSQGYRTLTRLLTRGYLEGQQQGVPVIDREWLCGRCAGLIGLSGGREGDVGRALLAGESALAARKLDFWHEQFGDRYYLEIQRTGRPGDEEHVQAAVELATTRGVAVVATNDVCFLRPEDYAAHEVRVCIQDGRTLADKHRPRHYSEQQYLRTPEEMAELFADVPEALENTVEIARRCNLHLTLSRSALPVFPIPEGVSIDAVLRQEAERGLEERLQRSLAADHPDGAEVRRNYSERLERELEVINQMGFPGYFLIVADFIRWAKRQGIPVGPGRGSGAGSLVAYALQITDLDPLSYDLLFERFLNPERVSMPDFDVDFCMENRDRVIDYVGGRYGRDKVSQIVTHGTMAARAVVRDVGRVLGHPYGYVDRIAKMIPFEIGITLEKALAQEEELHRLYREDEEVRTLLDMARKLEGLARNVGRHAGGVVIAPSDLTDFAPLYCEPGGQGLATQYDKDDIEAVGLVKFDFLGLRTLTIIDWTVKAVNAQRSACGESELGIAAIALNDSKTFELLKRCATTAVFQLESRGMKDLMRRLQPDTFEDIIALVALFRPGPLQSGMVDDFIARKHGRAAVAYPNRALHHEALEPILKSTYGIILYQEQVMQIAQTLAGYSLGGADLLRRAMGKKKPQEMAQQRHIFLQGATERGLPRHQAEGLFDLMEKFAGYGFNKSHSAAYALLAYQTAWLKAHYPAPFMAAVLSSDMDNTDKVVALIDECRRMQIILDPPDVNRSGYKFQAREATHIVYGLGAVKGLGLSAIEALIEAREAGGPYIDLFDLCRRVDLRRVNKRVIETLIRSGSLDTLAVNRATAWQHLPEALRSAEQQCRNRDTGQVDLFGLGATPLEQAPPVMRCPNVPEWDDQERLAAEKATLGLYLTGHPIERYEAELGGIVSARLNQVSAGVCGEPARSVGRAREGERKVVVAGLVVALRARPTQNGGRMGFITLDDRTGRMDVIVFPEAYKRFQHRLVKDQLLVVEGALGYDEFTDGFRVVAERVLDIGEARETYARCLVLGVTAAQARGGFIPALREVLEPFRQGRCPVWLEYQGRGAWVTLRLGSAWSVRPTDELLEGLGHVADPATIRIVY
ncbi:MAG: DNA polymerase III subunit alpha [Nitrococcus mobilis]|nr:DNA polymerase III subunit alpha [Nitrococcus mobilis]